MVGFRTFWFKRISLISLITCNDSYDDSTFVSPWYSYPNRLFELDFQIPPYCPEGFTPQRYH
jgi:hypothetical protein